jgi:hypothetical protein
VGYRLTRWLCGVCWTGTERPGALFDRAAAWLLAHKILLPGVTTLERFVVSVRARVEARLYRLLTRGLTAQQKEQLQRLLLVPEGERVSLLDQIRSGPTHISGPAIRAAIEGLASVPAWDALAARDAALALWLSKRAGQVTAVSKGLPTSPRDRFYPAVP